MATYDNQVTTIHICGASHQEGQKVPRIQHMDQLHRHVQHRRNFVGNIWKYRFWTLPVYGIGIIVYVIVIATFEATFDTPLLQKEHRCRCLSHCLWESRPPKGDFSYIPPGARCPPLPAAVKHECLTLVKCFLLGIWLDITGIQTLAPALWWKTVKIRETLQQTDDPWTPHSWTETHQVRNP